MITMTGPTRLFDCLQVHQGTPLPDMLAAKENGKWKTYSSTEINDTVNKLSAALLGLGISAGDRTEEGMDKVAIVSKNRPEWVMVDLAVQQIGAILTPIYPTITVAELEFILNEAQVKLIFVNDEELFHKVLSIRSKIPSLQEIYTFEHVAHARHWKELLATATPADLDRLPVIREKIQHEDLATIIYTSGTTGTPKGVMLSHKNILSNVVSCIPCL